MLYLCLQSESEIEYGEKVQKLFKSQGFGLGAKIYIGKIDSAPLKNLVEDLQLTTPIQTSLLTGISLLTKLSNFICIISVQLITILVFFYQSTH